MVLDGLALEWSLFDSPKRLVAAFGLLLILGLIALSIFLHRPHDKAATGIVIDRSALLPHRFAGVCMNCHLVREVGPVAKNRVTMNQQLVNGQWVSPLEQASIRAGMRVDVPTVAQRIAAPSLVTTANLPHHFVGVCSNCHEILDAKPSPVFMQEAFALARQPLNFANLGQLAASGHTHDEAREMARDFWGYIALIFLLISFGYVVLKRLIASYPERFRRRFSLKRWLVVHEWSAFGFTLCAILHWYYSTAGNTLLHLSLVVTLWLSLAGFMLRQRLLRGKARQSLRLLHSQQLLAYLLIVLLIVGHLVSGVN